MTASRKLFNATALFALGLAVIYNLYFTYDYVHVDIDKGTLRGFNTTTWRGTKFFAFKGIPYAKPPVGEFRFKAPREETAWIGVRDAVSYGSVCPQKVLIVNWVRGDEDCLFLNVYTPSLDRKRLPVMVWIHGGVFTVGSGNDEQFGPDYFIDAGVILVTINYRLGTLGFLSTGDNGAPGNAGLKDQVAALKWIQRNVANFGGDPDSVTIFGGSSGSASVGFHILSPMSSGLFAKAIGQSGSVLNIWSLVDDPVEYSSRLMKIIQAEGLANNPAEAWEYLRTASYRDIVESQEWNLLTESEEKTMIPHLFKPVIEKNSGSEDVFLPDAPLNILESGRFNKVPYMTGYNDKEGYLFAIEMLRPKDWLGALNDTDRYVPKDFKNEQLRIEVAESIRKFYFKDKPFGNNNMSNLLDLYGDFQFIAGIKRQAKIHLGSSEAPVYFYVFSYDGGLNFVKNMFGVDLPGACHGDELGYLFYPKIMFWRKPSEGSEDDSMIDTMTRLWTNFAKYGNPTPPGDPLGWKPATCHEFNYLNISGRNTKLDANPDPERTELWDDAYEKDAALRRRS